MLDSNTNRVTHLGAGALKDKAEALGATAFKGVATEVFRKASNGASFLAEVEADLGIKLSCVSQEVEGQLGYLSAAAAVGDGGSKESLLAYDSGAASFQITMREPHTGALRVYEGPWGSSSALRFAVEEVQGRVYQEDASANPMSFVQAEMAISRMAESLPTVGSTVVLSRACAAVTEFAWQHPTSFSRTTATVLFPGGKHRCRPGSCRQLPRGTPWLLVAKRVCSTSRRYS